MKVKRLIEILQAQDPEETVYLIGVMGGGDPLPEDMVGPTTRKTGKYPNYTETPCFGIYGE